MRAKLGKHLLFAGAGILGVLVPCSVAAGTQDRAAVAFHVQAHAVKASSVCVNTPLAQGLDCYDMKHEWPLATTGDVYLMVANANVQAGISALSCGIQTDPVISIFG